MKKGKTKTEIKKKKYDFFSFRGNKFTKLARDYHHEILHLTFDLRRINQRIQESATICHQQINSMKKKDSRHLISPTGFIHFENSLYHIENFTFRTTAYRDKIVQFINQALRIGFNEKTMGVLGAIVDNRIIKDAHLNTELKKFDKDKDFKEILNERVLLSHRRYYKPGIGYHSLMMPTEEVKDPIKMFKLWKQNIQTKVSRTDRIVKKVMEMNDRVVEKTIKYIESNS